MLIFLLRFVLFSFSFSTMLKFGADRCARKTPWRRSDRRFTRQDLSGFLDLFQIRSKIKIVFVPLHSFMFNGLKIRNCFMWIAINPYYNRSVRPSSLWDKKNHQHIIGVSQISKLRKTMASSLWTLFCFLKHNVGYFYFI